MNTKEKIVKFLRKKKAISGNELVRFLGVSRQALNKHLKMLIQEGTVVKIGMTKGVIYKLVGKTKPDVKFRKIYFLKGLEEDRVFKEIELFLNLPKNLKKNVFEIVNYTFTEILNNAIDHSQSEKCDVELMFDQYNCRIKIRDYGIGIFYSIFKKFNLVDENSAVGELMKGKTTTMAEKHTGEGVFFTSKVVDYINFRSHKTNLIINNTKSDIFVEEKKFIKGTEVNFNISKFSHKKLEEVFRQYAPEEFDYQFEKTRVSVKLFQKEYVSRSEARRLLSGLDKFKEVVLDFKNVKLLGQGFVDEIFRVFKRQHPEIIIKIENISPTIVSIIKHVVDNKIN